MLKVGRWRTIGLQPIAHFVIEQEALCGTASNNWLPYALPSGPCTECRRLYAEKQTAEWKRTADGTLTLPL